MIVNDIIRDAVNGLQDTYYLRATDNEANISIDWIDLSGITLCIYNNLPTINHSVTSGIIREWNVEIKVLQLADMDDDDEDGDIIRESCLNTADQIYDAIMRDSRISISGEQPDYTIDMMDNVKLYDKIMTGVELSFTLELPRHGC